MSKASPSKSLFSREYDDFLRLLRETRENASLTQAQVAEHFKRPQSFVSKCESGERRVDAVELLAFCELYKLDAAQFMKKLATRLRAGV